MGNKQSGFLTSFGIESVAELRQANLSIQQRPYNEWSVEDVCTWLQRVELESYVPMFRANKTDGAALGALDAQLLSTFYDIFSFPEIAKIIRKIEELKKDKVFKEPPYMRVMKKFLAASQSLPQREINLDRVREFAQYLSHPERLKEKYLNPDYAQTEQTLNALNTVSLTISSRPTRLGNQLTSANNEPQTSSSVAAAMIANYVTDPIAGSGVESHPMNQVQDEYNSDEETNYDFQHSSAPSPSATFTSASGVPSLSLTPQQIQQQLQQQLQHQANRADMVIEDLDFTQEQIKKEQMLIHEYKLKDSVKVKLVLVEISKSNTQKTFRKFLSPVMAHLDLSPKFGMFHSALIVGPWYLEWNASSLCVPRKCYSTSAMLVASLPSISRMNLHEAIDKIGEVVVDWNVNKTYSRKENNCQQFVEAVCANLGMDLNMFSGQMKSYLDAMRHNGMCDMKYTIPEALRSHFDNQEARAFRTHEELDVFVAALLGIDMQFDVNYKEDWMLLKSFDRAFWLKKYKFPDSTDLQPCNCPFGDPAVSASLVKEWF